MSASVSLDSTIVAEAGLLSTDLDRELIILSTANDLYYGLNETGARIWGLIQEPRRVQEIYELLLEELDVEADEWERDLLSLLQDLVDHGLARAER